MRTAEQQKVLWQNNLAKRYGRDRTCIWRWAVQGKLPPADVQISGRFGWYESTIIEFERATIGRHAA